MKKIYLLLALILIANCKPSKSDNQTSESDKTVKTKAYSETDPSKTRAIAVHVRGSDFSLGKRIRNVLCAV